MGTVEKRKTAEAVNQEQTNSNRKRSQCQQILDYLMEGHSITSYEAFTKFGCTKLTTRVSELRRAGANIIGEWDSNNDSRFIRYRMGEEDG